MSALAKRAAIVLALALPLAAATGCVPASQQSIAEKQRIDQMAEDIQRLKRELHDVKTPAPGPVSGTQQGERLAERGW